MNGQKRMRAAASGFTLVEVLVVIGIIAVLIGMLLPTLLRARNRAEQTKCAAQLHQLGVALSAYAANHNGWLPAWSGWHVDPPDGPEDEPGDAWTTQLAPYIGPPSSPVYTCPSFTGDKQVTYFISGRWAASCGRNATRLSEIVLGPQFVLGGENTNRAMYSPPFGTAGHATHDIDPDDANACCLLFPGQVDGFLQHRGGNNVLFGDLHVQALARADPVATTYAANVVKPWADVLPAPPMVTVSP